MEKKFVTLIYPLIFFTPTLTLPHCIDRRDGLQVFRDIGNTIRAEKHFFLFTRIIVFSAGARAGYQGQAQPAAGKP
jgi:hypothetical protein